nr:hypothetical protein Iba_chr04aCG5500 [Ipomoea batatas]
MQGAMGRFQSFYFIDYFQMRGILSGLMENLNWLWIHINYLKGSCGEKMPALLYQGTIGVLMCLWKQKLIKLLGSLTTPPLISRLNFIKKRALHHSLQLSSQ